MTLHGQVMVVCDATEPLLAAVATALAAEGATLVLLAPDAASLRQVAAAARRVGGEVHALPVRLGAAGSAERVAACVGDVAGRVDRLLLGGAAGSPAVAAALTAALRPLLQARPGGRVLGLLGPAEGLTTAPVWLADLRPALAASGVTVHQTAAGQAPLAANEPPWVSLLAWALGHEPLPGASTGSNDPPAAG
ncbi:MAG: hypothetical protein IT204_08110 [Fimbriimonadaceae bacterium]|nr:hypothetical protein [Fimbriimonadaceae bacterium]